MKSDASFVPKVHMATSSATLPLSICLCPESLLSCAFQGGVSSVYISFYDRLIVMDLHSVSIQSHQYVKRRCGR